MQPETVWCQRCASIYRLTPIPGGAFVLSCRCPPTPVIVTSGTSYETNPKRQEPTDADR